MAIPGGMARRVSLAVVVKRIVYFPTVWALGYLTVPPKKMPMLLFVVSLLTILHVHTYSTPTSHAKGRSMYSPLVLASVPPVMYFDMSPPFLTTWKPVGSNFGFGHRLILCILVSLHAFEHILGDQFHGRVELTGQDCDLLGESADLRGKLVDDVVRVGWNLLSQNVSLNTKPPQSAWIAGVEKTGKYWLVGGGHRVDARDGLKLVQGEGAAEIRLHVRESDGLAGIVERRKHATLVVAP